MRFVLDTLAGGIKGALALSLVFAGALLQDSPYGLILVGFVAAVFVASILASDRVTRIVLLLAVVVMAVLALLDGFRYHEPRVMAVEFEEHWASAVLEGNEIVPNLVVMNIGPLRSSKVGMRVPQRYPAPDSSDHPRHWQLTPRQREECWSKSGYETAYAPKGWRDRLGLWQKWEFERIYCTAVLRTDDNWTLNNCAWMRDGELVCD